MGLPDLGNILRRAACATKVHHAWRRMHRDELLVVMYHGVTEDAAVARRWWHHVHAKDFERQIRYLRDHYDVLSIDDALAAHWNGGLQRPTACVTFDDGYLNNKTVALPVLRKYGVPATVYLATGMMGTDRLLWTVELHSAFEITSATDIDLTQFGMGTVPLHGDRARTTAYEEVVEHLKELSPQERERTLRNLFDQLRASANQNVTQAFAMMHWLDANEMTTSGLITFGGHTVNHEIVSRLTDDDVRYEITESMREVEAQLTATTRTFAYPNGGRADFDDRAAEAVRAAGGIGAVSTIEGLCQAGDDRFAIKRIGVGSDMTFDQFRLLTSGVIPDIKRMMLTLRRRISNT